MAENEEVIDGMRAAVAAAIAEVYSEQLAGVPEPLRTALLEQIMDSQFVADQTEAFTRRFAGRLN